MIDYQELSWILTGVMAFTFTVATIRRMYYDYKEHKALLQSYHSSTRYYEFIYRKESEGNEEK